LKDHLSNVTGLLPYQVDPAEHLLNVLRKHGTALDASDMGTGKTYMASAIVRELDLPTLVVCPKGAISKWERVAESLGTGVTAINYERLVSCKNPFGEWWVDRGTDRWRWARDVRMVIFDECHRCGGLDTNNSKLMIAAKQDCKTTLALSATAAETPMRMKALGYLLGLFSSHTVEKFIRTPQGIRAVQVPGRSVSEPFRKWCQKHDCYDGWRGWDFYGDEDSMRKIHATIFPERGVRIKISDLGDQFPETQIEAELVDFLAADKINTLYEKMSKELARLAEKTKDENPEDPLLCALRERQQVELLKVPETCDIIEDLVEQGFSVPVFVNYRATLEAIVERLSIPCVEIHGSQTAREREQNLGAFQDNSARAMALMNQAGAENLDAHDIHGGHPRYALINPPYESWRFRQVTGRVNRAGGKSKSFQRVLCAVGTIEEHVFNKMQAKRACLDTLNDGDLCPPGLTLLAGGARI